MLDRDRPRAFRFILGFGPTVAGGHSRLACTAADRAKERGLSGVGFNRSKSGFSTSFYLKMRDRQGRLWVVRISDHGHHPKATIPNFDVVSRDGVAGRAELVEIVDRIAAGTTPWFDSEAVSRIAGKGGRRK